MLKDVKNMFWDAGLKKRHGYKGVYDHTAGTINGHFFSYMEGSGVTFIAVITTTTTRFYSNYSGTMTEINAAFTWSGASVEVMFAALNEKIVIVDKSGTNMPGVIYYDSGVKISTLDAYDARTIDNAFWFAGQFDNGATNEYIDDTEDAQSSTAGDFALATATNNDGFWIASSSKFSKVIFYSASQFDGDPVASYQYWTGSAWERLALVTTPSWTAAAGDRTLEFSPPAAWETWGGADAVDSTAVTVAGSMKGNYVIRVRFTTAPTNPQTCDYITPALTYAVTLATGYEVPTLVVNAKNRIWLVSGNAANYSEYGVVTGWQPYYYEYFSEGGQKINAFLMDNDVLDAVKDTAIIGLTGSTEEDFSVSALAQKGTESGKSCAVVKNVLFFESAGQIWIFLSGYVIPISKHIANRIEAGGYGIEYKGYYYYITANRILMVDPDTIQTDDVGDGIAAFWELDINTTTSKYPVVYGGTTKFGVTSIQDRLVVAQGYKLHCLDYGTQYFDETDTAIECIVETKSYDVRKTMIGKVLKRCKALINAAGTWTFTLYTKWKANNMAVTITSGSGGAHYEENMSVPYTLDASSYSFKIVNSTVNACVVYGFSQEFAARRF